MGTSSSISKTQSTSSIDPTGHESVLHQETHDKKEEGNSENISYKVEDTEQLVHKKAVVECPPGYPSPFAPTSRQKNNIYRDKFPDATERVQSVPSSALSDYQALIKHLTKDVKTDLEKVWSIYLWIVSQNYKDSSHGRHGAGDTPKGYLRWLHDKKGDIASFFAILCRRANIKCVVINGISKGEDYEVGMPEQELEKMESRWNAIYIDKNWRFVHPIWGSKGSNEIQNYFFLTEPEEFNTWCRPDDRPWQLLPTMVTMTEFANFPYYTAEFFMMNMKIAQPKSGKIRAHNGRVFVEISTTRNVAKSVVLRYNLIGKKLLKPRPPPKYNAGETTQRSIITSRLQEIENEEDRNEEFVTPTAFPSDLENFVFMWRRDTHFMFEIKLPVSGVYVFSVEAGNVNPDYSVSTMVVITEFRLYCFDNIHEEDIDVFPDVPEIGWGVTPHCTLRGIRAISHVEGEVFVLPDEDTTIRFELDHEYEFDVEMIGTNFAEDLQSYTRFDVHNNLLTIKVRIPGEGHYGLKVYAKGENDADFINKFPKRMMRERLEKCTEEGTRHSLMEALSDFKIHNVPDRGEIKKAEDKLGFFDDRKALSDAIKRKNPTYLQKAIQDAKKSRFTTELEEDIKRAELYLAKLNKMEGYVHPIAKLENSTLAEIRCYTWPPDVVRNVLTATYVLLGEDYEYLQDWDYIQSLMARVGKEGLKNKVLHFDSDGAPMNQVELADIIIEPHQLDEAREASTGTAALYQWVKHICTEKRSQQTSASSSVIGETRQRGLKFKGPNTKAKPVQNTLPKYGKRDLLKQGQRDPTKSRTSTKDTERNNKKPAPGLKLNLQQIGNGKLRKDIDTNDSYYRDPIHETKISSQHRFLKAERDNEMSENNRSPQQKTPSSKNSTPMYRSPASKYASPVQRSPASKYTSPVQKSPANRSPNQKSPTQKSPTQKSPQRFHVIKSSPDKPSPPITPSDAPPHRSPLQKPQEDEYLSPRGLSPAIPEERPLSDNVSPLSQDQK